MSFASFTSSLLQFLLTQEMQVNVGHFLPAILPHMVDELVTRESMLCREFLRLENEQSRQMLGVLRDMVYGLEERFGDEQKVRGSLGMDVAECDDFLVLIHDV